MTAPNLQLAGLAEVAKALGCSRQLARYHTQRPTFPAPVADLHQGSVWDLADVRAYARSRKAAKAGRASGKARRQGGRS